MLKQWVFPNANGKGYFIIWEHPDEQDGRVLLREISGGEYVVARHLDWKTLSWSQGNYFGDNFENAARSILRGEGPW